jgi:hypothetical protein
MPSKITTPVAVRLNNKDLAVIDALVEMTGSQNRTDVVRLLIKPTLAQLQVAMETKSVAKAAKVRIQQEMEFAKFVRQVSKASEIQTELPMGELQPA